MASQEPVEEPQYAHVYTWIDQVALSRPKKNLARDFSDGGSA
jgi:hypothetical protein